jgi:glycine oxidase
METPDILIVGAGVIGCSLARELARAGQKVIVIDRGPVGNGASSAAAGLLAPALATAVPGPLVDLCHESAAEYEAWLAELPASDVGFCRSGLLEVWLEPGPHWPVESDTPGRRRETLSREELRELEPALAGDVQGAFLYPDDAQVDPVRLTRAVARAAAFAGVQVREGELVHRFAVQGERITAVHTASGSYRPGTVVVAAGAWSGTLAELLHLHLPMRPVKGQLLLASCPVSPVRTPLFAGDAMAVPRADGTLVLGVTVEDAGFDDRATLDGVRTILAQTCALIPAIGKLSFVRAWAGLRPGTPDGLPYMGPVPPLRNLWVSTGHLRKGILLAPVCARLVAGSILAGRLEDALQPFRPTRGVHPSVQM